MSSIALFAALAFIGSVLVVIVEIAYREDLCAWRERHEMLFVALHFLLMLFVLNTALAIAYDPAGLLWTREHVFIAILSAPLAFLFGLTFLQHREPMSTSGHSPYIFKVMHDYKTKARAEAAETVKDVISRSKSDASAADALQYLVSCQDDMGVFVREIVDSMAERT